MVIVHRRGKKLSFPLVECGELPMRAQNMTACLSHHFEKMCGTRYEFIFLYSTTNVVQHKLRPWPPHAMLQCVSPMDPKSNDPVPPASKEFEWMSIEKIWKDTLNVQCSAWERTYAESSALDTLVRGDFEEFAEGELRPWEMPEWHNKTVVEATLTLAKQGYEVHGTFEQFQITPNAAVLRVNTNKGKVYLKASTHREGKIAALIGSFAPFLARKPIAVNVEKEWMLMNDYGSPIQEKLSLKEFENLSVALGSLQLESMKHIEELKEAGIPQESCESLICRTKKMLQNKEVRRSLGYLQSFECGAEDGMADLEEHSQALFNFLRSLYEDKRHPVSLVHGDIGPSNIIKDKDGSYILYDWGMAKLGFPMGDIIALAWMTDPSPNLNSEILHPYLSLWADHASISELQKLTALIWMPSVLEDVLMDFEYNVSKTTRRPLMDMQIHRLGKILVSAKQETGVGTV